MQFGSKGGAGKMNPNIYLLFFGLTILTSIVIAVFIINPILRKDYAKKVRPDISVSEMQRLEDNLAQFLSENNLKPGASIWKIARTLKVIDIGAVDELNSRARIYEPGPNGNTTVVHNRGIPDNERLFDFAHELGHRINGDPLPANRPHGYNKPKMDQLADYTGAALLMPLDGVSDFLMQYDYENASNRKRIAIIRKLCRKYHVSEMTAVRRVNEVRRLTDFRN